ncbi:MAG: hypothetical protein GY754_10315 [bacterium]|nr:hypothetical protein [bacterium]
MAAKIQLLIIDGQFDFCDPKGALYVPGAEEDMRRLAAMIKNGKDKIDEIRATLDSHRKLHIAHPIWWVNKDGKHPDPFTIISYDDVTGKNPEWTAYNPGFRDRSIEYVRKLKENGKYTLAIWPPHCLIGSKGHQVYPELYEAFDEWEEQFAAVDYVTKGVNMFTEHYSAVKADVEDPEDHTTLLNTDFIKKLQEADRIGIAGEALSHCVASTVTDVANEFGEENIKKFVLLEDATSPVPGFENLGLDFVSAMIKRGMQVAKTTDFLG